jgi:hypothetical protein
LCHETGHLKTAPKGAILGRGNILIGKKLPDRQVIQANSNGLSISQAVKDILFRAGLLSERIDPR